MRSSRRLQISLIVLVCTLFLAACQTGTPSEAQLLENCPTVPGICLAITGSDCPPVFINAGEQVTWINGTAKESLIRILAPDGQVIFEAADLQTGNSAGFILGETGSYTYTCFSDQESTGTITVQP